MVADAGYGDNPSFLAGLEERQIAYVCAVVSTFGVRLPDEVAALMGPPPHQGRGQPKKARPAPLYTAQALLDRLPEAAWQPVWLREPVTGHALGKQVAVLRVHRATGSALHSTSHSRVSTGPEGWLIGERPLPGETGDAKRYFSTLPAETTPERLIALAHARWVIERFYEDAKGECGLDDYQGRRWDGLHRHLALTMLAYSFLVCHRLAPDSGPDGGFPPLSATQQSARRASRRPTVALPRPRPLARHHQPDHHLPSP